MQLGKHVVGKTLIDSMGHRAGKVDDLMIEWPPAAKDGSRPAEVTAIISGPLALSRNLPRPVSQVVRQVYRLLGVRNPHPVELPWSMVSEIEVVVHVDLEREAAGLNLLADAVAARLIGRLPGA